VQWLALDDAAAALGIAFGRRRAEVVRRKWTPVFSDLVTIAPFTFMANEGDAVICKVSAKGREKNRQGHKATAPEALFNGQRQVVGNH
jgi:hypothetical protein